MNERIRNAIIIAVVGLGLIAGAVFFLTQVVRQSLAPVTAPPAPTPVTIRAVVVTHDIAIGTVLREGDVAVIDVPVEIAPRNTIETIDEALGRIVKFQMVAGEMLLAHMLADPTNINHDLAFVLPDNRVLMAFQPGDLLTSLGIPQRGDIVDILMTITRAVPPADDDETSLAAEDEELIEEQFTLPAFQLIEISAVVFDVITAEVEEGQPTPMPRSTDYTIHAYLLAIEPQNALLLKYLVDTGANFDLVLRAPTSTQLFELVPVTDQYLIDLYQLELP
ncbi:MAG TPA: SAF domain-containing protein [Anaerolineales bacterium]|nr:SAF domain-containing protein [Anaerolineales bacterium]